MSDNDNKIELNSEQITVIKLYDKEIRRLNDQFFPVARRISEMEEQLELAKTDAKRIRGQLQQQEVTRNAKLNEFAVDLGYTNDQSWRYDFENFAFIKE